MHARPALQTVMAVASSDLLTVAPRPWLELPVLSDQLAALPLIPPVTAAPVCIVRQTGIPLTPMAQPLCDVIRRVAAHYEHSHVGDAGEGSSPQITGEGP